MGTIKRTEKEIQTEYIVYVKKVVNRKEFNRLEDERIKQTCVKRVILLKNKHFTKRELDQYVKQGLLTEITHKRVRFYPREELAKIVREKKYQLIMF